MSRAMVETTQTFDAEKGELADVEDDALQAVAIALRVKGYKPKEIAIAMDVPVTRVRRVLTQGRTSGALKDVVQDLHATALPLAVEKLIEKLEDGHEWAIKETLRGLGAFRTHTAQQIDARTESRELVVSFVQPDHPIQVNPAGIVGQARGLEVLDAPVQTLRLEEASEEAARDGESWGTLAVGSPRQGPSDGLLPSADAFVGERVSLQSPEATREVARGESLHESPPNGAEAS